MLSKPFHDLQQWVGYFAEQPTPILAHTHIEMRGYHARIDEIGLNEIGELIRHDPLLTLNILRHQEEHRHSRQTTDVTTIERVLLMIGVVGFFRLFGSLPCLENQSDTQKIMLYGAHRTCARSYLASLFAERMSNYRRDIEPKEVITAALLHDTAETLLWLAAPRQMMQIHETLRSNPSMRSQDAQISILGCKFNQIQQGLIEKWHLPRTLLHLIDDHYADEPRVKIVHLATSMARHLEKGWDSPYFREDIQIAAEIFHQDPYLVYEQVRDVALKAAREWQWYDEQPAAALLIRC